MKLSRAVYSIIAKCLGLCVAIITPVVSSQGSGSEESSEFLYSEQETFNIGGWISSPAATLISKWSPIFESYLTEEIGPLYDPPIRFSLIPLDYDSTNTRHALIEAGKLDFAFQTGGGLTCLEAQYGFSTIATQVSIVNGHETMCYGAVIYTLKSNTAVANISGFRGKRLGVGYPLAPGGYQLGAQYLESLGLHIFTSFSQVVFYMTDYEGLMNGILSGHVDIAMTQSGWLEANFPQEIPKLLYHNLNNATFHSVPYPIPTTTMVVPAAGLSSAPHISIVLKGQILKALARLNETHPAAQAAGISRFVLPESYESARALVEHLQILKETPSGKECVDMMSGLKNIIACPIGYALEQDDVLAFGCEAIRLSCPAGTTCYCRPCHPDVYVSIFPWQVVLGLCCALFVVGLLFSLGWSSLLEAEQLATSIGRSHLACYHVKLGNDGCFHVKLGSDGKAAHKHIV